MGFDRFKIHTLQQLDQVARKSVLEVFKGIIMDTPVKSGRARGNWQGTIGAPASGELEVEDPSGSKTISAMQAQVLAWKAITGVSILLTNNVPYIGRLNGGSSTQTPARFVERNVMRVGGIVQEAV